MMQSSEEFESGYQPSTQTTVNSLMFTRDLLGEIHVFTCKSKSKYSGPSLKGTLERTPLYKGHKFLAATTMNVCNTPSHQRTPPIKTELFCRRGVITVPENIIKHMYLENLQGPN